MNLAALKTEITNDPVGIGYAAVIDDHVSVAKLLNKSTRTIDNPDPVSPFVFFDSLDAAELDAVLSDAVKSRFLLLILERPAVMFDESKGMVQYLFPAASKSFKAWRKAAKRSGSRSEELGFGRVTESDVADALLRT